MVKGLLAYCRESARRHRCPRSSSMQTLQVGAHGHTCLPPSPCVVEGLLAYLSATCSKGTGVLVAVSWQMQTLHVGRFPCCALLCAAVALYLVMERRVQSVDASKSFRCGILAFIFCERAACSQLRAASSVAAHRARCLWPLCQAGVCGHSCLELAVDALMHLQLLQLRALFCDQRGELVHMTTSAFLSVSAWLWACLHTCRYCAQKASVSL